MATAKTHKAIALSAEPSIRDVADLHRRLLELVAVEQLVTIDAAAVSRIDFAVLQVLLAFVRDRRERGLATRWAAPSETLRKAAALLDLAEPLGLTPAEAG